MLGKLKDGAKGLASAFNSIIPLNKLIDPKFYLDTAHSLDAAEASVVRNTNATREYASGVAKLQAGYNGINNSAQEAANILSSLYTGYNKFNLTTDATREAMNRTATVFTKLGYSTEAYAKNTSEIGSVMNKSAEEASNFQKKLGKAGFGLNMTIGEINSKFTQTMDRFTIFGKRMGEQFLDMQTFAKNAGMELEKVMDMTEKLSTFEGAADIAGNINSLLNKNILDPNTLIALSEDPIKQLEYLQKQLKDNVKLEGMGVNMQRALNKAVGGLAGGADIRKLMNASPQDLKRMTGMAADSGAMSDKELEVKALESMTAAEKGKNGVDALGSAAVNAVDGIKDMHAAADAFAKGISGNQNSLNSMAAGFIKIGLDLQVGMGKITGGLMKVISKIPGMSKIFGSGAAAAGSAVAKGAGGLLGKTALRAIPLLGSVVSGYSAYQRFSKGDLTGGLLDTTAAIAGLFPGIGTGISLAATGANLARDFTKAPTEADQGDDIIADMKNIKKYMPGELRANAGGIIQPKGQKPIQYNVNDKVYAVKDGKPGGMDNSQMISMLAEIRDVLSGGLTTHVSNMEPMMLSKQA
jgi:hypothetical protein